MQNSLRLGMGASALLYLGPLLAGLSGMGWSAVPVFVALFALWLVVMHPAKWPRDLSVWTGQTAVAAAAQVAVNALMVVLLFGIGRGIGGVAGFLPHIHAVFPVALSFLATPLSRLAMDPARGEGLDGSMAPLSRHAPDPGTSDEMVAVLFSLPDDSDAMLVADAVDAALKGPLAAARLQALQVRIGADGHHRALREGLILWATDLARSARDTAQNVQNAAFQMAGSDPLLLHLFAHRGGALLASQPSLRVGFPKAAHLRAALTTDQPQNLQAALRVLADALDA